MTRAILRISSSPEIERQTQDLVLRIWRSGQDTVTAARAIRIRAEIEGEPLPSLSLDQAYAANVIDRHQDALYAARQQEAQRAGLSSVRA